MILEILGNKCEVTIEQKTYSWGGVGRFLSPPTSLLPKSAIWIKGLGNAYIRNYNEKTLEFEIGGAK